MSGGDLGEQIQEQSKVVRDLVAEVGKVLVGQDAMVSRLLMGLLSRGHVLLEGVPGLAKTLMVRSLAEALDTEFSRIQFTPDMLPADVVGTEVFNPKDGSYSVKQGPIFSNVVLADEINRAPAKVQAALLECMQEQQTTIGSETFKLADPFLVLATQNPIEQEGTYPLPEAQIDRFMLKVVVSYPSADEERKIIDRMAGGVPNAKINKVAFAFLGQIINEWVELGPLGGPLLVRQHQVAPGSQLLHLPQGSVLAAMCVAGQLIEVLRALRTVALNMLQPTEFTGRWAHI